MWPYRYDIAKLANLDIKDKVQKQILDQILEQHEADDNWDENDSFQKAYKACGLKRYKLSKKDFDVEKKSESFKEEFESEMNKDAKSSAVDVFASSGSTDPVVKVENPEMVHLTSETKVTRSAAQAVGQMVMNMKSMLPTLLVCASNEGALAMLPLMQAMLPPTCSNMFFLLNLFFFVVMFVYVCFIKPFDVARC